MQWLCTFLWCHGKGNARTSSFGYLKRNWWWVFSYVSWQALGFHLPCRFFFLRTECDECKGDRGNEFLRANELSFKISTFFGWLNGSSMKLNSKLCPFTFFSPSIYKYILTLFFPSIRFVATISFFSPYSWPLNVCVHIPNQWLGYSSSFFSFKRQKNGIDRSIFLQW